MAEEFTFNVYKEVTTSYAGKLTLTAEDEEEAWDKMEKMNPEETDAHVSQQNTEGYQETDSYSSYDHEII